MQTSIITCVWSSGMLGRLVAHSSAKVFSDFFRHRRRLCLPVSAVDGDALLGLLKDKRFWRDDYLPVHLPVHLAPGKPQLEDLKKSYCEHHCNVSFDL